MLVDIVKEQRMDIERVFRNFDYNRSNEIDNQEFGKIIQVLDPKA